VIALELAAVALVALALTHPDCRRAERDEWVALARRDRKKQARR
jgi:hypothetical protein